MEQTWEALERWVSHFCPRTSYLCRQATCPDSLDLSLVSTPKWKMLSILY